MGLFDNQKNNFGQGSTPYQAYQPQLSGNGYLDSLGSWDNPSYSSNQGGSSYFGSGNSMGAIDLSGGQFPAMAPLTIGNTGGMPSVSGGVPGMSGMDMGKLGLGAAQAGWNMYSGLKQLGLDREKFRFGKDQFYTNIGEQRMANAEHQRARNFATASAAGLNPTRDYTPIVADAKGNINHNSVLPTYGQPNNPSPNSLPNMAAMASYGQPQVPPKKMVG